MPVTRYVVSALDELRAFREVLVHDLADGGVPSAQHQDVALLATELVTNAITYADPPATVRLEVTPHDVRLGVADRSSAPPQVQAQDPHRVGGNGLRIVEAFADEWGSDPSPHGGKEIWFRLAR